MSISAEVWDVTAGEGGMPKLWLGECGPDPAGQASLQAVSSCSSAEQLVGRKIWAGGSGPIMCGDTVVGNRIGYTRCVLFNHGIREAAEAEAEGGEK